MRGVPDHAITPPRLRWQLPVYSPLSPRALGAALRVALSGADPRPALARSLAEEFEAEEVTLCGSGTDALERAIRLAGTRVERGAAVALPAYSCFNVATSAIGAGLPITLYDIDPGTLGPDLDSLRRALADGARVVVVAPLYGMPVDWAALEEVASAAGAVLIEDAAQGQGARWQGRRLGSLGAISVLSFGRGKGWTGGGGGALLIRGGGSELRGQAPPGAEPIGVGPPDVWPSRAAPAPDRSIFLSAAIQWAIGRPSCYGLPASIPQLGLGETRYREPEPARGMARAAAALLEATRAAAEEAVEGRRAAAEFFLRRLPPRGSVQRVLPIADGLPGYLRLALRIPGIGAELGRSEPARRLGVAAGYPRPLAELPVIKSRLVGEQRSWPGAVELVRDLVTLPTHALVSGADRERVVRLLDATRSAHVMPAAGTAPAAKGA